MPGAPLFEGLLFYSHRTRGQKPIVRNTLRATWRFVPVPFSDVRQGISVRRRQPSLRGIPEADDYGPDAVVCGQPWLRSDGRVLVLL